VAVAAGGIMLVTGILSLQEAKALEKKMCYEKE